MSSISSNTFYGIAYFAIQFVYEGNNRRITQTTYFHKLNGSRLYSFGTVNDHKRRVYSGQGAVRIFGKILVAGRIEQVDHALIIGKLHDRCSYRYAPLLLHGHPIRSRMAVRLSRLNGTRKLDRATEQQQLFCHGGFARIGVRDDGESAPVTYRFGH